MPEIFPFLGSSRLEHVLNDVDVRPAFHGHEHIGSPEGPTSQNVPVYNVSIPVLEEANPDRQPFRVLKVET